MLDQFVVIRGQLDGTGVSIVRNAIIFGGFLLAVSSVGWAGDDPRYPAYDFEPKVIISAPEGATGDSSKAESPEPDSRYPAAYFEPKVIIPASEEAAKKVPEESPQPDPRYPAYHFEPKVIYQEK
ncbi:MULTISPECIES: hypothetical protein [Methylocaldum]|jgi:hypothetical protein|uniref:hypothetical protein n=1 Tax=Methylocaldum sp. GT1TLB TaxID=3438965 RepID=UPI003DA10575